MNASQKNLVTQVGLLALAKQNQSKDAFPSDREKKRKEKKTKEEKEEIGGELK